jgi:hypothetical protein
MTTPPSIRVVSFNQLPAATRARFIASVAGTGGARPFFATEPEPLFMRMLVPLAGLGAIVGVFVVYSGHPGFKGLVLFLLAATLLAFGATMSLVDAVKARAFPWRPGAYVFGHELVIARTGELELIPLSQVSPAYVKFRGTPSAFSLSYKDKTASFPWTGGTPWEEMNQRVRAVMASGDVAAITALDPFHDARQTDFRPSTEPGPTAGSAAAWTNHPGPISLASGVILGLLIWSGRAVVTDQIFYGHIVEMLEHHELTVGVNLGEIYAKEGLLHRDDMAAMIPKYALQDAIEKASTNAPWALTDFLKKYPTGPLAEEARREQARLAAKPRR